MCENIKIEKFLKSAQYNNNELGFCEKFYSLYIKDYLRTDTGFKNFKKFLLWNHLTDGSLDASTELETEMIKETFDSVSQLVDRIVSNLIPANLPEDEFYKKIWATLCDKALFANDLDIICALLQLNYDLRIPYFRLGPALEMDNEEYMKIYNELYERIQKCFYVINRGYPQKTQVASQLYQIIGGLASEKQKIVLIAYLWGCYNDRLESLSDNKEQNESQPDQSTPK